MRDNVLGTQTLDTAACVSGNVSLIRNALEHYCMSSQVGARDP